MGLCKRLYTKRTSGQAFTATERSFVELSSNRRPGSGMAVIPFGMHRGLSLADAPRDYLEWVADNLVLEAGFRKDLFAFLGRGA